MYGGYFLPEFHVLPTFGYAVLAANPTGSTGYGQAFMDAIRGDWTGRPARELLAVIDHAVAEGWSDDRMLAVMGGSYGGHLAAALTTQSDRFRAAAVDRMYPQTEMFWGATDEKWFPEWEFGGRPFDPDAAAIYRRNNPFEDVARVRTPTLISHGLQDFRCPQDGSVAWYSALQARGVPARLLRFHDEGHGLRGRSNQIFYLEQLLIWFERYVLEAATHD
jgi:dipeptidyl aminopeptidase/acylaminoacyl peptidase